MEERKCFICGGFGYIVYYYRNRREERSASMLLNKFEVLKDRVMNIEEGSGKKIRKEKG